jgi:MerR family transcriptional regulator, light-induced transcriptional regulator
MRQNGAVVDDSLLTMGQVAEATGLSEPTLRAWERRFGYPAPVRGPAGRRRYPAGQVHQLRQINRSRKAGLSLEAAVERAVESSGGESSTVFASLAERPGVRPLRIHKRELTAVVRGLEDELMASGARTFVFAGFQREHFYRQAEARYREMARLAEMTLVRADFESMRRHGGVMEVPLGADEPSAREWCFISDGPGFTVALAAWEVVDQSAGRDSRRSFELVWSADAAAVRNAARTAVDLAAKIAPEVAVEATPLLEGEPPPEGEEHRRLAAMANRVLAYLVEPERASV